MGEEKILFTPHPARILLITSSLEGETHLSLEHTVTRTAFCCGSPEVRVLNVKRRLTPVRVVQHIGGVDA
jgi:hypothetical protein